MYDCKFQERIKIQESLLQFKFVFFSQLSQHKVWTLSMDSVKGAHGFSGHGIVCLDIVQGISGQCPHFPLRESPWIMSRSPWTFSREMVDNTH